MNKNIIALGFVSFFTDMASSMVTSILPLFVVYVLHEGVDKLGYIVAVATFVSYGFRFVFGYLSDRYRIVKPFVVTGYALSAVTKPLLALSGSWGSIAALRGLERIGKAVRSATKDSLISAYAARGKSGATFGFHKSMDIAGELMGSVIAFGALYLLGQDETVFRSLFAWTLLPGILAVIVVFFFVEDAPYTESKKPTALDLHADRPLLPVLMLFFGFTFFLVNDSFYLIKAKEAGYTLATIPLLVVALNLTQTLLSYRFGVNVDRFGARRVLLVAFGFGFASLGALYLNWILPGFILLGIATVASLNAIRAYISDHAQNKGSVYGLFYGGVALSGALGAIVTGWIWQHYGESVAVGIALIGLGIIGVIFGVTQGWRDKRVVG